MRLLHLITRLDIGGSSENVLLSARGAAAKGWEALVASGPSATPTLEAADAGVARAVLPALTREIRLLKDAVAFLQICRLLRAWRPAVLHTHSSKAGFLGRWAAWACNLSGQNPRILIVHTPHGHVFYGYFGRMKGSLFLRLERITALVTDALVAISEGERRESLGFGIGKARQWTVVPSGVLLDPPRLSVEAARARIAAECSISSGAVWIGTVARLEPVKGIRILVEAAPKVAAAARTPVFFLVVGDGEERQALAQRARELGVSERVVFAGYRKDAVDWMRAMDIYVQPSLNEGMGKTLIQAQALGLPVVASRVCGIPDVVREGETGLLVPSGDPPALSNALLRLLGEAGLRERMGRAGQAWAREPEETGLRRFGVEAMAARLERLYAGLETRGSKEQGP